MKRFFGTVLIGSALVVLAFMGLAVDWWGRPMGDVARWRQESEW